MKVRSGNTIYVVHYTVNKPIMYKVTVGGKRTQPPLKRAKQLNHWISYCKNNYQDIYFTFSRRKALSKLRQLTLTLASMRHI